MLNSPSIHEFHGDDSKPIYKFVIRSSSRITSQTYTNSLQNTLQDTRLHIQKAASEDKKMIIYAYYLFVQHMHANINYVSHGRLI